MSTTEGALFELSCCGSESTTNGTAEAQDGSLADDGTPERTRSPGVVLTDTVTRLQREMKELRSDSMCNHTGETPTSPQHSRRTKFTSTKVPKFAGVTSWDPYRQVFDAIVLSKGWDDSTAVLQLLSHLEGTH